MYTNRDWVVVVTVGDNETYQALVLHHQRADEDSDARWLG